MKTIEEKILELRLEAERHRTEAEAIRKEAEAIRKEAEAIRKEIDANRKKSDEESRKIRKEIDAKRKKSDEESRKIRKEIDAKRKKSVEEHKKIRAEIDMISKRNEKEFESIMMSIKELRLETGGIGESNGRFAEYYFYAALKRDGILGGVVYDEIDRNKKKTVKSEDGKTEHSEYDIFLLNGDSVALVEVKYRVRKRHVDDLKDKRLQKFKKMYPEYSGYKYYLGIAGLAVDDDVINLAEKNGIAVLRFKNDDIEILDKNLKIY